MKKKTTRKTTKKRNPVAVNVQSGATGLTHFFSDLEGFEKIARDLEQKATTERTIRLAHSLTFWNWLTGRSITTQPSHQLKNPIFRICFNGFNPLDVSGSLASGGRFNIGGAQVHSSFNMTMAPCLYGADSQKCATDEVGRLLSSPELYELTPKAPLLLWDLLNVINSLDHQSATSDAVKKMVDSLPMDAAWVMQKFPAVSQLLAHRLRAIGGDGIIYPSIKCSGGQVIAIFVKDNSDAQSKFISRKI